MFIVEKGMPGFSLGQQINNKCGMRASGLLRRHRMDCSARQSAVASAALAPGRRRVSSF